MATTATSVRAAEELDELYRAHAAEVYRYVYAVLGNSADAEDVTQTTFVNALRALESGERPRRPTNWLITIAHNLIRQRFRSQQTRPREVELDRDVPTLAADDDDSPSIDDLVRALQRIPPAQREALVLREMEGRSYKEIASILEVSVTALETLIFRARRSLAEELENLVTCDRAELAVSQRADRRLGRKESRRLAAHLAECPSCARVAAVSFKRRRAFKGLALLPLPVSLTLFKGTPSAAAAIGLPSIGATAAGTAAGVGASGLTAKFAVGLAAVAVAGGAGYEGVQAVREPETPRREKAAPAAAVVSAARPPAEARAEPVVSKATPPPVENEQARRKSGMVPAKAAKPMPVKLKAVKKPRPERVKAQRAKEAERGRSAAAPGRTKTTLEPAPKPKAERVRVKRAKAPGKIPKIVAPKPKKKT